jgi:hypothetical protein
MPAQKNQHFVPRCVLKPFSFQMEGRAINLYNLDAKRSIRGAPVKGQCSRDYFYGKDLRAENTLAELEGHYARIVDRLVDGHELTLTDEDWLRLFVVIQTRRTARAIAELNEFAIGVTNRAFKRKPDQRPRDMGHDQLVKLSVRSGIKMHDHARDLKFIVLRNQTEVDFITSDHPAMVTNKFSFEKLKEKNFGIGNSGIILVLPLSPKLAAFFFDIGVYTVSIPAGSRFVDVRSTSDVRAINQLQHLNAQKNLYFASWADCSSIAKNAAEVERIRSSSQHRFATLVRDHNKPGEAYRAGTKEEELQSKEMIITASFHHPKPSQWPGILKYRAKPTTFTNGSAVGHLRKEEWLRINERTRHS